MHASTSAHTLSSVLIIAQIVRDGVCEYVCVYTKMLRTEPHQRCRRRLIFSRANTRTYIYMTCTHTQSYTHTHTRHSLSDTLGGQSTTHAHELVDVAVRPSGAADDVASERDVVLNDCSAISLYARTR